MKYIVTKNSMRPACPKEECFYCQQSIGEEHKEHCVLIKKKVKVRMVVEYEIDVPASWDADDIEHHRNAGSWCTDNAIEELLGLSDKNGCICNLARFEYISDCSAAYVDEG